MALSSTTLCFLLLAALFTTALCAENRESDDWVPDGLENLSSRRMLRGNVDFCGIWRRKCSSRVGNRKVGASAKAKGFISATIALKDDKKNAAAGAAAIGKKPEAKAKATGKNALAGALTFGVKKATSKATAKARKNAGAGTIAVSGGTSKADSKAIAGDHAKAGALAVGEDATAESTAIGGDSAKAVSVAIGRKSATASARAYAG